jgi:aspartyl-tRNA(Asn)/glutamyl-tRNA(Gln) amidotransferase subunit A
MSTLDRLHKDELAFFTISKLSFLLDKRALSSTEIVGTFLRRINTYDARLHSYITVCHESALRAARDIDSDVIGRSRKGHLHGLPIAHKDVSATRGVRTTAHSRPLMGFVPREDATHVNRLSTAGMILLGKTNTQELACGGMEIFGIPRNPWNPNYYAGGSSGGSATAIAAGLALAATGSDTGGSIRIPAAMCGIVGLKPTYGRVSRFGLIPLSWSMDHVGPMTRNVRDCALLLKVMAGYDKRDLSSTPAPVPDYEGYLEKDIKGLVLGIPQEHFYEGLDAEVDALVRRMLRTLESLGARLEQVSLPMARDLAAVCHVITSVEEFCLHRRSLRANSLDLSVRARRKIARGAFFDASEYHQATQLRQMWINQLDSVLHHVDALVVPTLPFPPYLVEVQRGGKPPDISRNTRHFNLSGHPALSVPCGFTSLGLPVGVQMVGKWLDEGTLFRVGAAYEAATHWNKMRPPLEAIKWDSVSVI